MTFGYKDLMTFDHKGQVLKHEHKAVMSKECAVCDALHSYETYKSQGEEDMMEWAMGYLDFVRGLPEVSWRVADIHRRELAKMAKADAAFLKKFFEEGGRE